MSKFTKKAAAAVLAAVMVLGLGAGTAWAQGRVGRVLAFDTDVWTVTANDGDTVTIRVQGDGDTDLDVAVLDGFGRVVVADRGYTDRCFVQFRVITGGAFTVHVRNLGDVYNDYRISTTIR